MRLPYLTASCAPAPPPAVAAPRAHGGSPGLRGGGRALRASGWCSCEPSRQKRQVGTGLVRAAASISGSRAARALAVGAERLEHTSSRIVLHLPRLSVAVLAVSRVDSVPYPPAHSRASSISLPAISADATRWSGAAGRCGTVAMGDRAWWRPSAEGAQELRRLHKHLELRRHRWHCGTSPLGKTSDWRDAHRPGSAFHIATGPLRHPLALGRHDAARGRSARARAACCWDVLRGR